MRADAEKCVARFINLFCWSESGSPDGSGIETSWPARVPMLNASVACESDVGLVLAIERAGCAVTVVAAGKTLRCPVSRSHRANTSHQCLV